MLNSYNLQTILCSSVNLISSALWQLKRFLDVLALKLISTKVILPLLGCDMDKIVFSKRLNCGQMEIPFKYLGMKIGGNPKTLAFWKLDIDKIKSRLSIWKGKIISMAGRICLIKSVLNALPLFYFSFFKAPTIVCNIIRRTQAKFLLGWGVDGKKIACVAWDKVCPSVEEGGLGIKMLGSLTLPY